MVNDQSNSSQQPPQGIPGRRLTGGIGLMLLLATVGLSYVLWTYNRLDDARFEARETWHGLADQLANRYQQIELVIAEGVDSRQIDMALGEKFRLAVERFRTTAQPDVQVRAAREIEELLFPIDALKPPSIELQKIVEQYNQRLTAERDVLDSVGGRLLSIFINLSDPAPFLLAG